MIPFGLRIGDILGNAQFLTSVCHFFQRRSLGSLIKFYFSFFFFFVLLAGNEILVDRTYLIVRFLSLL